MEPMKEIARVLRRPAKGDVDLLDEKLGRPVAAALAELGIAARDPEHAHSRPVGRAKQFILHEPFELPPALVMNVRNVVNSINSKAHYLAFTCAEAWQWDDKHGFPAHLRWGYAIEAKKTKGDPAHSAFRALKQRISDGDSRFQILPDCPLAGLTAKEKPGVPATWLWFLGRRVPVEELEESWSVERVLEEAVRDISDIYKALAR